MDLDPAKVGRLLDRIEKHAGDWAYNTAYQFSHVPGSTRYYQAIARAHKAEASFQKAVGQLRDAISWAKQGQP